MKHALEECTMLRCYYAKLGLPNDDAKKKGASDGDNDKDDGFPEVHNAFMIFGGPSCASRCASERRRAGRSSQLRWPLPGTSTSLVR